MRTFSFNLLLITSLFFLKTNSQTIIYSNIVNKDIFQVELASFQTIQKNELEKSTSWSLPSALFRYGFNERIELQMVTPFNSEFSYYNNELISSNFHIKKVQLGAVVNILERNKIIPETSFTYRSIVPFNENDIIKRTAHLFSINMSNKLSKKIILNYNFRYFIGSDKSKSTQYVSNLGYNLTNKFQLFIENNGVIAEKELTSNLVVGGLSYVLSNNLFINMHYGKCLKRDTLMVGGILTWRFKTA